MQHNYSSHHCHQGADLGTGWDCRHHEDGQCRLSGGKHQPAGESGSTGIFSSGHLPGSFAKLDGHWLISSWDGLKLHSSGPHILVSIRTTWTTSDKLLHPTPECLLQGTRTLISNKFPGDSDAAGPGTHFENHCSEKRHNRKLVPSQWQEQPPEMAELLGPRACSRDLGHVCGLASSGGFRQLWC